MGWNMLALQAYHFIYIKEHSELNPSLKCENDIEICFPVIVTKDDPEQHSHSTPQTQSQAHILYRIHNFSII